MVTFLSAADVRQCITMHDAMAAIEDTCREQAAGRTVLGARVNLPLPNGWMRLMPAALLASGVVGYKEFHLNRVAAAAVPTAEVRYAFHLFDYETGEPLAQIDASLLTATRTAAAAGVAARLLAPADATSLGVIGSGSEARTQTEAIAAVRPLREVRVFSRDPGRRATFAREMGERLGLQVTPVDRPEHAVEGIDVLVVATNTAGTGPAFLGEWLQGRRGLHISSIGSTLPSQREIDPAVWAQADRIVLDTRKALEESGDCIAASAARTIDEAKVAELQDVVAGQAPARQSADEVTLYKSVGTGLQDLAVAYRVFQRAREQGLGWEAAAYQAPKEVEPN